MNRGIMVSLLGVAVMGVSALIMYFEDSATPLPILLAGFLIFLLGQFIFGKRLRK